MCIRDRLQAEKQKQQAEDIKLQFYSNLREQEEGEGAIDEDGEAPPTAVSYTHLRAHETSAHL
eukprot:5536472-Alexandrium_andersonii.AAC.1